MPLPSMDRYWQGYQMVANMMQGQQQQEWQRGQQMWQRGMQEKRFGLSQEQLGISQEQLKLAKLREGRQADLPLTGAQRYYSEVEGAGPMEYQEKLAELQRKAEGPTAEMQNYLFNLQKHERDIGREQRRTFGPPIPSGMVRERAEDRAYDLKYGKKPKTETPAKLPSIQALDKMIKEPTTAKAKKNAQILRSRAMRNQFKAQGIPYDTSGEDDLIMQLKGKNVDWVKLEADKPDLDWGYIWEQLGVR